MHYLYIMPVFYVFTFVHCTAFYSPATGALINNNNNNNNTPFFGHDRRAATKFDTHMWIDLGMVHT